MPAWQDKWESDDGSVVLYHGDAIAILPTLETGSVDAVVTDPQYGISDIASDFTRTKGKGTRRYDFFENDGHEAATDTAIRSIRVACGVMNSRASTYIFCGHRQFGDVVSCLEANGFTTRFVVWSKSCPCPAPPRSGWPAGAELCVYGYRPGRVWNPQPGDDPKSNVLTYDGYRHGQPGKVDHPTQKPLGLIKELISYSTLPGQVITDPFMGSATTGVACIRLGRKFIGIEIEPTAPDRPDYFGIAVQRCKDELARFPLWEKPTPSPKQMNLLELQEAV